VSLKHYRYTGMERDEETGLNYHGARYYAPWLGRWTAADPIGIIDSLNLFVYVNGNPIILNDLNGNKSKNTNNKGLRFSSKSEISVHEFVAMIRRNEKLEPWMKDFFMVKDDRLVLNPKLVKSKKQGLLFTGELRKYGIENVSKDIPGWFLNTLKAIDSGEWVLTTGTSILSDRSRAAHNKLVADTAEGDPKQDTGIVEMSEIHVGGTSPLREESDKTKKGLVVIATRFRDQRNKGPQVSREENAILQTFFHELSAHAALLSEGDETGSSHQSSNWRIGLLPMSKADELGKDVYEFFGEPNEDKKIRIAKAASTIESVGVITSLDEEEKKSNEIKQNIQNFLNTLSQ